MLGAARCRLARNVRARTLTLARAAGELTLRFTNAARTSTR